MGYFSPKPKKRKLRSRKLITTRKQPKKQRLYFCTELAATGGLAFIYCRTFKETVARYLEYF
jgi:hypothetical protein